MKTSTHSYKCLFFYFVFWQKIILINVKGVFQSRCWIIYLEKPSGGQTHFISIRILYVIEEEAKNKRIL